MTNKPFVAMPDETIACLIRRRRQELGLSARQFSILVGTSRCSRWESGENIPNLKHMKKIAEALGFSEEVLIHAKGRLVGNRRLQNHDKKIFSLGCKESGCFNKRNGHHSRCSRCHSREIRKSEGYPTGITGYKGVSKATAGYTFRATYQRKFLGSFVSPVEAARAYDKAVCSGGKFPRLNFPEEHEICGCLKESNAY